MDISPTTTGNPPIFTTASQCRLWLESKPFTGTVQGQAALLKQLGLANRYPMPAEERLAILDVLAPVVQQLQKDNHRRFTGRPLPLSSTEQAGYEANLALWKALIAGYLRCLYACLSGEAPLRSKRGTIVARALRALAEKQLDTYRGGGRPETSFWHQAYELYSTAEQLEVTDRGVPEGEETPLAIFAEIVLLHLAGLHELPARHAQWAGRWAHRWAPKLLVSTSAPPEDRALPLCLDLSTDGPPGYLPGEGKGVRWLDTKGLRASIVRRLALLEEGQAPAKLGLGNDCNQPACGQLLKQLYRRWCKGGIPRRQDRRPAKGNCAFVAGFEAIHYYLSGRKPFRPPGLTDAETLRREREEIATFGRVPTHRDEDFSRLQGFQVEQWEVLTEWEAVDESTVGMQIACPPDRIGNRIGTGQLVALRPPDSQNLMLGSIRWVAVSDDGRLHAGIQVLPGLPQPVAVRGTGLAAINEKYRQAFLLPAIGGLSEPATIVVPSGWFKRDCVLEVFTDSPRQIRLTHLFDRGPDYERVAYEC